MAYFKTTAIAAVLVTTIGFAFLEPAYAQQTPACAERTAILKHLAEKYTETPVALGLANNGGVLETLVSKGGDSWTIIITMPNGATCMVAAGENWEKIPRVPSGGGV